MSATAGPVPVTGSWNARRFFDGLRGLGRLRVISRCGPSTFEALCEFGPHGYAEGYMNAITDAYHWHLKVDGFRHLASHDRTHARSGRRVLFFELREHADAPPFLLIYLHREKGAEFERERVESFQSMHAELSEGVELAAEEKR